MSLSSTAQGGKLPKVMLRKYLLKNSPGGEFKTIKIVGVAELRYESGCRDVALLRLIKDFGIM
jgi:hypothetical protein